MQERPDLTSRVKRRHTGRASFFGNASRKVAGAVCLSAMVPTRAIAHVKWFTTTNVHDAPVPIATVLSPTFLAVLALFTSLVFLGFLVDGAVARRFPRIVTSGLAYARHEERLVRAATGAYFICTAYAGRTILTPELRTANPHIAMLQFAIACALVWRPTCVLAGLGILALYGIAIGRYGAFHLTDYVFVPCLALYLASLSIRSRRLRALREPMLVGGLAFSLAWTAIEKFLYPQWTAAVIAMHPSIALGLAFPRVTVIAGFVEFTLAFFLVTGRGLLRLGGAGYALIFIAAMPAFGRKDVYGHLIILSILAIVALRGATPMQNALRLHGRGLVADSARIVAFYLSTLIVFFAAYDAMQRT